MDYKPCLGAFSPEGQEEQTISGQECGQTRIRAKVAKSETRAHHAASSQLCKRWHADSKRRVAHKVLWHPASHV